MVIAAQKIPFGAISLLASLGLFSIALLTFGVGDSSNLTNIDTTRWSMRALALRAGVSNLALVCAIAAFLVGSGGDRRRAGYSMVIWLVAGVVYAIAAQTIMAV
jgi:hypothetical protein